MLAVRGRNWQHLPVVNGRQAMIHPLQRCCCPQDSKFPHHLCQGPPNSRWIRRSRAGTGITMIYIDLVEFHGVRISRRHFQATVLEPRHLNHPQLCWPNCSLYPWTWPNGNSDPISPHMSWQLHDVAHTYPSKRIHEIG